VTPSSGGPDQQIWLVFPPANPTDEAETMALAQRIATEAGRILKAPAFSNRPPFQVRLDRDGGGVPLLATAIDILLRFEHPGAPALETSSGGFWERKLIHPDPRQLERDGGHLFPHLTESVSLYVLVTGPQAARYWAGAVKAQASCRDTATLAASASMVRMLRTVGSAHSAWRVEA